MKHCVVRYRRYIPWSFAGRLLKYRKTHSCMTLTCVNSSCKHVFTMSWLLYCNVQPFSRSGRLPLMGLPCNVNISLWFQQRYCSQDWAQRLIIPGKVVIGLWSRQRLQGHQYRRLAVLHSNGYQHWQWCLSVRCDTYSAPCSFSKIISLKSECSEPLAKSLFVKNNFRPLSRCRIPKNTNECKPRSLQNKQLMLTSHKLSSKSSKLF